MQQITLHQKNGPEVAALPAQRSGRRAIQNVSLEVRRHRDVRSDEPEEPFSKATSAGETKVPDRLARAVAVDLQQIPELIFQIASARQSRRGKKTAERGIHRDDLHVISLLLKPNPLALSPIMAEGALPMVCWFMQDSHQKLNTLTPPLFLSEFIDYYGFKAICQQTCMVRFLRTMCQKLSLLQAGRS